MSESVSRPGSLFERLGGRATLVRVHASFYGLLLSHSWLAEFFRGVPRHQLENQQTDFMAFLMGGPKEYRGRMPASAHTHLFITDEIFSLRHDLLRRTLESEGIEEPQRAEWLHIDASFRSALVKKDLAECKGRYTLEDVIAVPNPRIVA